MNRAEPPGPARRFVLGLGLVALLGLLLPVAPVAAATDRLHDLRAGDLTRGRFTAWLYAALGPDPIP